MRYGAPPGVVRPRGHLVLRVAAEDRMWHADVGFGRATLFEPIPYGPGAEHEQLGWRYRVVREEPELVLQGERAEGWVDLYGFLELPVPPIDVETVNWWVATNPRSPFVTGLLVSLQKLDGTRLALSTWDGPELSEATPSGETLKPVEPGEIPGLLASRFGLPGFSLDERGRPQPPDRP